MTDKKFTWVETHKQLTEYLSTKENSQLELIELLKTIGIEPFNDKADQGEHNIELDGIDPFTFFCYIYKYGAKKRLKYLQKIAEKIDISIPNDEKGIPSAQAQKVWLFPYKYARVNNEISRLWSFFNKAITNTINDSDFEDILQIKNIGTTKLTEALFYIKPEDYLPINGPTKSYLEKVLGITPQFDTYSEYQILLQNIKSHGIAFYELSYEAYLWNKERKAVKAAPEIIAVDDSSIKYWLYAPGKNASSWDNFYEEGIMGLGWDKIGDLNKLGDKDDITTAIQEKYNTDSKSYNNALANIEFRDVISIGDIIIPKRGRKEYLGYGIVSSGYYYDVTRQSFQKCRKVHWIKEGVWKEEEHPIVLKTLTDISKYPDYVERLKQLIGIEENHKINLKRTALNYSLNTIFYGPPGTGKTYNTVLRAAEIIEDRKIEDYEEALKIFRTNLHDRIEFITFHQNYSYEDFIQGLRPDTDNGKDLIFEKKDGVFKVIADMAHNNLVKAESSSTVKMPFEEVIKTIFEDLIEGVINEFEIKMKKSSFFMTNISEKSIEFRKQNGESNHTLSLKTLNKMYDKGINDIILGGLQPYYNPLLKLLLSKGEISIEKVEVANYVIIIDEINRANISRVFGELITLIEEDKRSHGKIAMEATLPSGDKFIVPSNLYIIGTMNTADKSIALLDIALRRRFEFEAMYPQYEIPGKEIYDVAILEKINKEIIRTKGHDFQIGHAYFMDKNKGLVERMNKKVIPLLLEYYMNDENEVRNILMTAGLKIDKTAWPLKIEVDND